MPTRVSARAGMSRHAGGKPIFSNFSKIFWERLGNVFLNPHTEGQMELRKNARQTFQISSQTHAVACPRAQSAVPWTCQFGHGPWGGHPISFIILCDFHVTKHDFSTRRQGGGGRFREFPQKLLLVGRPSVKHSWLVQALQETTGQGSMVLRNTLNL